MCLGKTTSGQNGGGLRPDRQTYNTRPCRGLWSPAETPLHRWRVFSWQQNRHQPRLFSEMAPAPAKGPLFFSTTGAALLHAVTPNERQSATTRLISQVAQDMSSVLDLNDDDRDHVCVVFVILRGETAQGGERVSFFAKSFSHSPHSKVSNEIRRVSSQRTSHPRTIRGHSVRDTHPRKIFVCTRQVVVSKRNRSKKTLLFLCWVAGRNRSDKESLRTVCHSLSAPLSKTPTAAETCSNTR